MHSALKVGLVLPAVALMVSGCVATRNWVTEHVNKKEVEIDQKIGGVDSKVATQSQRVDGVDTRLKTAEGGLVETGQVAKGARERADGAFSKADEVDGRLTRLWSNRNVRDLVEAQQILFGFDKWELNDNAQTSLLSLVKEMKENVRLTVDLQGYADLVGRIFLDEVVAPDRDLLLIGPGTAEVALGSGENRPRLGVDEELG